MFIFALVVHPVAIPIWTHQQLSYTWARARCWQSRDVVSVFIRSISSGISSVVWLPKQGTKPREKSTSRKQEEAQVKESRQARHESGKKVKDETK